MNFKKTLALCLSLLILLGCAITGTLAFPNLLSDTPAETEAGETAKSQIVISLNVDEDEGVQMFPGKPLKKKVTITNTSASTESAYVWYTYAVPKALFQPDEINESALTGSFATGTAWQNNCEVYNGAVCREVEYGGKPFIEFTCMYDDVLGVGASTGISLESVTLDAHINRENGTYIWIEDGESTPLDYNRDTIEIYFHAYAISATGFSSVQEAYGSKDSATAEATAG